MPASVSRPLRRPGQLGRLWWLPANGQGNGLDDAAWAPLIDVTVTAVQPLLAALRTAGVPAYAAPAPRVPSRPGLRAPAGAGFRLWVGTSAYGRAEQALLTLLPNLRGGDSDARL
jgi:hypothetical protein